MDKIETYNFQCEAGPLTGCAEWSQLKELLEFDELGLEELEASKQEGTETKVETATELTYYGTKQVKAVPMTRGEYNIFRGWTLPENENGDDLGYRVEYLDGGAPNVEGFAGYISWSPKEQFDNAYQSIDALSYGHIILAVVAGKKATRVGWSRRGYIVNDAGLINMVDEYTNTTYPFIPETESVLANDWQIVG